MANNFRLRNQLGQFIALENPDTASSYTVNSYISDIVFEDHDHKIDPINNFEELNLNTFQPESKIISTASLSKCMYKFESIATCTPKNYFKLAIVDVGSTCLRTVGNCVCLI